MEKEIKYMLKDNNIILDDDQVSVVLDESDKLLVVAGAGSGKTLTMIAKIYYLVNYKKTEPHKILMIAFTNEAVNEIKERLEELNIFSVNVMTFHKFGLVINQKCNPDIKIVDKFLVMKEVLIELCSDKEYKIIILDILIKYYNINISKINLYKADMEQIINYKQFSDLVYFFSNNLTKIANSSDNQLVQLFTALKEKYYQRLVMENLIDFDMMIVRAKRYILNGDVQLDIEYIFVDEYQDISLERFDLLHSAVTKFNSSLIAVGDDWQSIYRFAGSSVKLFVEWDNLFEVTSIKYLNNTYRNSQELINIAGRLIMTNKNQFAKKLLSNKNISNPIKIYYYINFMEKWILHNILDDINKFELLSHKIMILGRYKKDELILKNINGVVYDKDNDNYRYKRLILYFYTIHSSKGLGYDEVVILNMRQGKYGFPSNVQDSKITSDFFGRNDNDIEEERRLFYVAITRTKNRVYIIAPYFNRSIFAKEIKRIL